MAREDTDLPFGDAFSPAQLDTTDERGPLAVVLELVKNHEGDPNGFDRAVKRTFFPDHDGTTRSKNVRLGLSPAGYEVTDPDFHLTDIGTELYKLRDEPERLYDRFARHILRNLHGLKRFEIIEDLRAQDKLATNDNLKQEFREQYDFHIDRTSNHWSQMRAWLSEADVVNTGTHRYDINHDKIEELVGAGSETVLELDGLTRQQQMFLRALALIDPDGPIKNSVVRKVAEEAYGVTINQSNISRRVLDPLEEAGYIEWEHVSGKPNRVDPTAQFEADVLKPILDDVAARTGAPRSVLRNSYEELLAALDEGTKHERGQALEALAIKIGRTLGLEFVGWRVRPQATGGSEVDVVFYDVGTLYNRVQIQAKNTTDQIDVNTVAREIGLIRLLQTTTVLMIARGGVSTSAEQYARHVMKEENISIAFLTQETLEQLDENTDALLEVLQNEARRARTLKRLDDDMGPISEDSPPGEALTDREQEVLDTYSFEIEDPTPEADLPSLDEFTDDG